ncbi:MAG: hypothetical protein JXB49_11350 [Bacteroidales bacterium]|nr:hypothetical protein [Bacteroidales bacterium]
MKKTICITGMDGTGKSTLIKSLAALYPSCYIATIWDLMTSQNKGIPFNSKKDIDDFLCGLTPDSRLLFLAHAMKYSIDKALESYCEVVIIDSYYYKYFAMEKALGANVRLIESLIESFPIPDIVLELVLPIDVAFERKTKFSNYECGLFTDVSHFKSFQAKVFEAWEMYDRDGNWHMINARKNPDEVLAEARKYL